jgi:hypothetical protein
MKIIALGSGCKFDFLRKSLQELYLALISPYNRDNDPLHGTTPMSVETYIIYVKFYLSLPSTRATKTFGGIAQWSSPPLIPLIKEPGDSTVKFGIRASRPCSPLPSQFHPEPVRDQRRVFVLSTPHVPLNASQLGLSELEQPVLIPNSYHSIYQFSPYTRCKAAQRVIASIRNM